MAHARSVVVLMVLSCILAWTQSTHALHGSPLNDDERIIRLVVEGLTPTPDGRHEAVFSMLRSLHDPALRPVFSRLSASADPTLRVHGILGLAELSNIEGDGEGVGGMGEVRGEGGGGGVDLVLVRRLQSEQEQADVLRQAMMLNLISSEQIAQVTRWSDVSPMIDLLLMNRLVQREQMVPFEAFAHYLDSSDLLVSATAGLSYLNALDQKGELAADLFATKSDEGDGDKEVNGSGGGTSEQDRLIAKALKRIHEAIAREDAGWAGRVSMLLSTIQASQMSWAQTIVERCLIVVGSKEQTRFDQAIRIQVLETMLLYWPELDTTQESWLAAIGEAESEVQKYRLGMTLLEVMGESARAEHDDAAFLPSWLTAVLLVSEHDLLQAVGRVAVVKSDAEGGIEQLHQAVGQLLDTGYASIFFWAVEFGRACGRADLVEMAARRCLGLGEVIAEADGQEEAERIAEAGKRAVMVLCEIDSGTLERLLDEAIQGKKETGLRLILAGLFRSGTVCASLVKDREMPTPFAKAMADLLVARWSDQLSEDDLDRLEMIAMGVGQVPFVRRVQAGWLIVRERDQIPNVLARFGR